MKYAEFAKRIKEIYNGKFPDSMIIVKPYKCLGNSITIDCFLAGNRAEFINGIAQNDMLNVSFMIHLPDHFDFESDELTENLILKALDTRYAIKPEIEYLYCDYRKIPYRKVTGTPEKLIAAFGKFTDRLYAQITDDIKSGNIHGNYVELLKRKV